MFCHALFVESVLFSVCGICVYGSHHVTCFNGHAVRSQLSFRFHKRGTKNTKKTLYGMFRVFFVFLES